MIAAKLEPGPISLTVWFGATAHNITCAPDDLLGGILQQVAVGHGLGDLRRLCLLEGDGRTLVSPVWEARRYDGRDLEMTILPQERL